MQLPPSSFDPETVALMGRVCDDAWSEAQSWLSLAPVGDATGFSCNAGPTCDGGSRQWRA